MLPELLRNKLQIARSKSERKTRQGIKMQFRKTNSVQKSIFYEGF